MLTQICKVSNDRELWNYYKQNKKDYQTMVTKAKRDYNDNYVLNSKNKPSGLWKIINKDKKQINHDIVLDIEGKDVSDPKLVISSLGKYFGDPLKLPYKNEQTCVITPSKHSLYLHPTNHNEVESAIKSLASKMSCGMDGILSKIVKLVGTDISVPLSHIINSVFTTGVFLNALKQALVCPVYKKGCTKHIFNYPPVSSLPSFSKVFESGLLNRLTLMRYSKF
ncbi:hypothetical protein QE152_g26748 [Popillia japonica]|uniref:Reverse transcriptase n=1 Tax=Popillia japonica TaxID=7064 RepID=A0AAW1JYC9_POPJA